MTERLAPSGPTRLETGGVRIFTRPTKYLSGPSGHQRGNDGKNQPDVAVLVVESAEPNCPDNQVTKYLDSREQIVELCQAGHDWDTR